MRKSPTLPLIGALLLSGCEEEEVVATPGTTPEAPDCDAFPDGATDFDWTCCSELIDYCNATNGTDCDWICNG